MSSSLFVQRLNNLFDDINSHLAFQLEKIAPTRREAHIRRVNAYLTRLEAFSEDDDLAVELLKQIRMYRIKLEIRANKLCNLVDKSGGQANGTVSQLTRSCATQHSNNHSMVPLEQVPHFSGKVHHFAVYLTALEDLVLCNSCLTVRAKYRKIFYSLDLEEDQLLLAQHIDPNEPHLDLVIDLLRKRYEGGEEVEILDDTGDSHGKGFEQDEEMTENGANEDDEEDEDYEPLTDDDSEEKYSR